MKTKRKYLINSCIVVFLVNGLLINGFCIYTALVFNEGEYLINKILFSICGGLFVIFLVKKGINVFKRIKCGTDKLGNILKETVITILYSILLMLLLWMVFDILM